MVPGLQVVIAHPRHPAVKQAAWMWQCAFLMGMMWGHIPPGRTYWFCTLQHPGLAAPCSEAHCRQEGCLGNVLRQSADGSHYTFEAKHHKMSRRCVALQLQCLCSNACVWSHCLQLE